MVSRDSEQPRPRHCPMNSKAIYGAFNARWKMPSEVARTFVPTPAYTRLVKPRHSLLMGPRGCGKTTLLKMLTMEAQEAWLAYGRVERLRALDAPEFRTIYIPSDIRWSQELETTPEILPGDAKFSQSVQRALVNLSAAIDILRCLDQRLVNDPGLEERYCIKVIELFALERAIPRGRFVQQALEEEIAGLRALVVSGRLETARRNSASWPTAFLTPTLDLVVILCSAFDLLLPTPDAQRRWGICFDEIEIAPAWLQEELLAALRSIDQRFLLKLTWSPFLPELLQTGAQPQEDYDVVRLWFSHVVDATSFCESFATEAVHARFGRDLPIDQLLGTSVFAKEERPDDGAEVYEAGSAIWEAMRELALRDPSFRAYLVAKGIPPEDPVADSMKDRNESLRKVKPIVLLRETFLGAKRARSRKRVAIYSGKDAVFAMSDGNPRWLNGLLTDLLDTVNDAPLDTLPESADPLIRYSTQARVLAAASNRVLNFIRAFPTATSSRLDSQSPALHVSDVVRGLGGAFQRSLLGSEFTDDPRGSFIVDSDLRDDWLREIERGVLLGVFVFVGSSIADVPYKIVGSRFRLSFMLAPAFRLSFRNFRAVSLSTLIDPRESEQQLALFQEDDHDS